MVEVSWIIANLLYERRDTLRELVALLKVHNETSGHLLPDLGERLNISTAVDRDSDDVGPVLLKKLYLAHGRVDILRLGRAHGLGGDMALRADNKIPYPHRSGLSTGNLKGV